MEQPGFFDGPEGDISGIEIEGDSATANLDRGFFELAREAGRWYIQLVL